jgi:hypothetical protein
MPPFVPNDRPPRAASRPPRWPTIVLVACLGGFVVSLLVTVLWSPQAGWLFLAFAFASLIASALRGVRRGRSEADAWPVRLARRTRLVQKACFVTGGAAGAFLVYEFTGTSIFVWFAFLTGGMIGSWIFGSVLLVRFMVELRPPRDAERSELALDLALGLAATSLEQASVASAGWVNVIARCVASAYDAGLEAARSGDPRRATHLTLRRESVHGRPEPMQAAWAEVIDAARRGIAAAESEKSPTREQTP